MKKKLRQRLLIFSEKSSSCQMISHLKKYFICRFFFCFTCAGGGWSGQSVEVAVSLEVRKLWQVSQACVGKEITISRLRLGISSVQELYLFGSDNKHINDGKANSIHDWLTVVKDLPRAELLPEWLGRLQDTGGGTLYGAAHKVLTQICCRSPCAEAAQHSHQNQLMAPMRKSQRNKNQTFCNAFFLALNCSKLLM